MGRPRRSSAHHADRLHVEIEHLLFFLPFDAVLTAQGDHLADDLDVEAFPFGLAQDVLDVIAERLLFLVEPLDSFDEREKLLAGNGVGLCGFGHLGLLCPLKATRRARDRTGTPSLLLSYIYPPLSGHR